VETNFLLHIEIILPVLPKLWRRRYFYETVKDAEEVEALDLNEPWTAKDLPPGKKTINNKLVHKVKLASVRVRSS